MTVAEIRPIKVKVLVKVNSFCCKSVSRVSSFFSTWMRVELRPTQATTQMQVPVITSESAKRKGFNSPLGLTSPVFYSDAGSITEMVSDLMITQSAGTRSPTLRMTTSPTTSYHISMVCICPFFPRKTGTFSSLVLDCSATN